MYFDPNSPSEAERKMLEPANQTRIRGHRILIGVVIVAGIIIGIIGIARAEEYPRTTQMWVCLPTEKCEKRGRPSNATACDLNATSEVMHGNHPAGTVIKCRRIP